MNYNRILATAVVAGLVATAFWFSTNNNNTPTVTERIDNAFSDLATAKAPIPHEKLHARALEILQGRTVAKDDTMARDDLDRIESCIAFSHQTMDRVNCMK